MLRFNTVQFSLETDFSNLKALTAEKLGIESNLILSARLSKKSVDARKKQNIIFVCNIDFEAKDEKALLKAHKNLTPAGDGEKPTIGIIPGRKTPDKRPVVAGSGPAGLFAALTLAVNGQNPIVLERGSEVEKRSKDVRDFWENGLLNPESNVQFGEGGAGTFSDGKLTTGTKDPLIKAVISEFYECGAKEEILYLAKPHIGTDYLKTVVKNLRQKIISLGGEFRFDSKLVSIGTHKEILRSVTVKGADQEYTMDCDHLVLAVGHSARDTFHMLFEKGVVMAQKPFAIGVRIEHPQKEINKIQYGRFAGHKNLPAADYKLAVHLNNGRSLYTFCMCPGGFVVASSSEEGMVVTNGMSESARDRVNANSALLVGIDPKDFSSKSPLAGIDFQRRLERKAFLLGGGSYKAPVTLAGDLLEGRAGKNLGCVEPSYKPGVVLCDFRELLPEYVMTALKLGLLEMDQKMKGFAMRDAVLTGVETRSSSPVRILRDQRTFMSNIKGVYPCGEGSGYAGGIVSSAVDGIKSATALISN